MIFSELFIFIFFYIVGNFEQLDLRESGEKNLFVLRTLKSTA
jgi:hypothetical protein